MTIIALALVLGGLAFSVAVPWSVNDQAHFLPRPWAVAAFLMAECWGLGLLIGMALGRIQVLLRSPDIPWEDLRVLLPGGKRPIVRFYDLAATEATPANRDPDWTAGALVGLARGEWYILDVRRTRTSPAKVEDFIYATHELDDEWLGVPVPIYVEQEGGSSGKIALDQLARGRFVGLDFHGQRPVGSKDERAVPVSVAAERGGVHLLEASWNETFLQEAETFPDGLHDDQIDAVSGAFSVLRPRQSRAALPLPIGIPNTAGSPT